MEVKEFNDFKSIETYKENWDALIKSEKPEQWFFHTYDWYKNWWSAFGGQIKPVILLVFEAQELIGVAPCGLSSVTKFGIPYKQLSLLANEHSPKNTIITKGNSYDIIDTIIKALMNDYPDSLIYFEDIAKGDPLYQNIVKYKVSNNIDIRERVARTTAVINIKSDWAGYIQQKAKKFRTYTRKIARDYQNNGCVIKHYRSLSEIDDFFKQGQIIANHSWQGDKHSSLFSQEHLMRFYHGYVELSASEGILDILCLVNQTGPIAYLLNIQINNNLYLIKQEYDSRYSHIAPGFYLDLVAFQEAFTKQLKVIDMLGFTTNYKERWATELREDTRMSLYQNRRAKLMGFFDFNMRNLFKSIIRGKSK